MIKTTPMIFNTEMVRALLAGNKARTRRIVKPQPFVSDVFPSWVFPATKKEAKEGAGLFYPNSKSSVLARCPFGKAGDLIYVRETSGEIIRQVGSTPHKKSVFKADSPNAVEYYDCNGKPGPAVKWKPSIHMPRWASRLTLKINSVRVERIQDISEADAKKEGISFLRNAPDCDETLTEKQLFGFLWDSVYPESWNKNEWVWVIGFEVIHKNIDLVLAEMEQAA